MLDFNDAYKHREMESQDKAYKHHREPINPYPFQPIPPCPKYPLHQLSFSALNFLMSSTTEHCGITLQCLLASAKAKKSIGYVPFQEELET